MITGKDAIKVYRSGFTHEEVDELKDSREQIDFSSPAWKAALAKRKQYSGSVRSRYYKDVGLTLGREAYDRLVNQRRSKNSAFEWLKLTYLPKKKVDFQQAKKRRAKSRTARMRRLAK